MEKAATLLLLLLLCSLCYSAEEKCPQPCDCQHLQHVLCSNRGLVSVPKSSHILNPFGTKTYSLGGNFISNISAADFSNYYNLQRLDLQYNRIHFIHPKAFDKLAHLEELYLGNNQLQTLTSGALSALKKLKVLNVNSNRLQNVSRASFSSLGSLIKLRLDGNHIQVLHGSPFQGLSNLLYLHLENNRIANISKNAFAGLVKLRLLSLSGNPLNSLRHPTFLPLRSLSTLSMAGNDLQQLGPGVFNGLQRLSKLVLSSSRISLLHSKTFQGLGSLQELHLDGNVVSHLPESLLASLHSLEVLNMSHNSLSSLQPGTFNGLSRLRVLDLQYNMLSFLPGDILAENPALYKLQLDGNGWNCNCHLLGLKHWILGTLHTRIRMLTVFVKCREPQEVAGKYLDYLEDAYLQATGDCVYTTTPKGMSSTLPDEHLLLDHTPEGQKSEGNSDHLDSKASSVLPVSTQSPKALTLPQTLATVEPVPTTKVPAGTKRGNADKRKKIAQKGKSRDTKTSGGTRKPPESKFKLLNPSQHETFKQLPFKQSEAPISASNNLHHSLPDVELLHQQPPDSLNHPSSSERSDVTGTLRTTSEMPNTGDSHLKSKKLPKDIPDVETFHQSHPDTLQPSFHSTHPGQSETLHQVAPFPSILSDPCEFNKLYLLNLSVEYVGSTTARVRWQTVPHTHGPVLFRLLYERFGQGGRFQRFVYPRGHAESLSLQELTGDTPYLVCVESLIGGRACPVAPREHCAGLVTLPAEEEHPLLNYQLLALVLLGLNALLLLLGLVAWGSRVARKKWCRKRAPVHVRQMYSTRRPYRSVGTGVSTDFSGFQSHRPRTAVCALGETDLIEFPGCERFREGTNLHRDNLLQRFTD
ncbi:PREDICTED: TLR4 interactor with leucine rich repeats [Nanorana parkeri]|uniref:TLR4 interactor with leucine rich repeats n=1 Tax=Nanorana parkeri TaxID=125878 RepID=UPI0008546208|nr:PREDICTED: TLR4 interactor with leucine rich repeats [Nanorana parkeri]